MLFIGIDLAWSERNASGIAILKGGRREAEIIDIRICYSDEEIISFLREKIKNENAFTAIDAPLIVPNEKGKRIAEKLVESLFKKYDARPYPANRKLLTKWTGKVRGEDIAKKLEKIGFVHNPYIEKYEKARKFFEVFTHPAMIVLFKLKKILRYKARPKRDYCTRWKELEKYQSYLKKLEKADPPLLLQKTITHKNVKGLKGEKLKNYEDLLDAIFCAYIAYYCWCKPEKCKVLGDMKNGYILTPI